MRKISIVYLLFIFILLVSVLTTGAQWLKTSTNSGNYFATLSSWPGSIKINEIMANPAGADAAPMPLGEWVELYNSSSSSVDVAGYTILDADSHSITISVANVSTGSTVIAAGGWLAVYRNGDGSFSLNNDGDTVVLKNTLGNNIDTYTYVGTSEDLTWSKIPDGVGGWFSDRTPTPGSQNL